VLLENIELKEKLSSDPLGINHAWELSHLGDRVEVTFTTREVGEIIYANDTIQDDTRETKINIDKCVYVDLNGYDIKNANFHDCSVIKMFIKNQL